MRSQEVGDPVLEWQLHIRLLLACPIPPFLGWSFHPRAHNIVAVAPVIKLYSRQKEGEKTKSKWA